MIEVAPVPGKLEDASKFNGTFALAGLGETVNLAVGVSAGGRITPGGTRRISVENGLDDWRLVPTPIARLVTVVVVSLEGGGGGAGAVYTTVARPFARLTTLRADNLPKST